MSEEPKKLLFTESVICLSNRHCMNCRFSPIREKWFETYEVPDDIWDKCARGKTLEEIQEEHEQLKKEKKLHAPKSQAPLPSAPKQVANFAKAVSKRAAAKLRMKKVDVSDEVYEERYAICKSNECGKMIVTDDGTEKCGACGCPWKSKLKWATESCPLGYWENII